MINQNVSAGYLNTLYTRWDN